MPITSCALDSLIRTQGIGNVHQIDTLRQRAGINLNLAYIPANLLRRAYRDALQGGGWEYVSPGFVLPASQ